VPRILCPAVAYLSPDPLKPPVISSDLLLDNNTLDSKSYKGLVLTRHESLLIGALQGLQGLKPCITQTFDHILRILY
jgi:hypothetical protein